MMEVWIFDRSGCYSPGAFNIHEEPERFIKVIAGYAMMNEEELGLDTFTEQDRRLSRFIHIEQDGARKRLRLDPTPLHLDWIDYLGEMDYGPYDQSSPVQNSFLFCIL